MAEDITKPPIPSLEGIAAGSQRQRQRYIADVLSQKPTMLYRPDDYSTIRKAIFGNVADAIGKRFPLYNDKVLLTVENVKYDDQDDIPIVAQKQAILQGKSLGRRLRGNYVLKDAVTEKVLQKGPRQTLMKVPYMTDRGTFIRSGHEYTFNNIMRLEPGVYTKKNNDDEITAQFNVKRGTGAGFNMRFIPSTGLFQFSRGTTNAPAYAVFKELGMDDEQIKKQWGPELFQKNKKAGQTQKARIAAERLYNY